MGLGVDPQTRSGSGWAPPPFPGLCAPFIPWPSFLRSVPLSRGRACVCPHRLGSAGEVAGLDGALDAGTLRGVS